jgi:hypothetical protein
MRLPKKLNNTIDFLGIIIPLIVDLVMNIVSFSILAPDFLSRIAFIALAIMIVVFVPRAWSKRQFISYAIFVSVVVFADWSFTLATTGEKINTTAAVTQDVELERLRGNIDKTELKIEDLHKQYYEANKRETLQELNAQIQFEQNRLQKLEADYEARLKHTEQKAESNTLNAEDIFNAIPNAIKERRIIPLIVWFLVFLGVQLVVATSIDIKEEHEADKAEPVEVQLKQTLPNNITLEDVKSWVHGSYYHITNQGSNLILSMENFFRLLPNFSMNKYPVIRNIAEQNGIIDKFGHALIIDETEAVKKIIG